MNIYDFTNYKFKNKANNAKSSENDPNKSSTDNKDNNNDQCNSVRN